MNTNKHNTIIIAAMFCSGKTTLASSQEYKILDVDELSKKYKLNSAMDYTNRIRAGIGEYDIILIHPNRPLLSTLHRLGIEYSLVYPENTAECKEEWARRNTSRGTEEMWKRCKPLFESMIKMLSHDKHAKAHYTLKPNEYLSDIIDRIYEEQAGSSEETKENNEK